MPFVRFAVPIALQALILFLLITAAARFCALLKGCYVLRRYGRAGTRDDGAVLLKSPLVPTVSTLVVAREFQPEIRDLVRRLLGLHFGQHEVVLVIDGPTDAQLATWVEEFHLVPSGRPHTGTVRGIYESREPLKMVAVDKQPGSAGEALNDGMNVAAGSVIALFASDSEIAPDCLLRLIRPMLEDPERTAAVLATAPGPASKSAFAAIETLRMWLVRCAAFSGWDMLVPVPGCATLLRREVIAQAGGFRSGAMELLVRLHGQARAKGRKFRVGFVPSPVAYLPPPRGLRVQRRRIADDQRAIARAISRHRIRALGWGLPGLLCSRLLAPLAETAAYVLTAFGLALHWIPPELAALALLATIGAGILISMAAVVLRELALVRGSGPAELRRLFFAAIPENLGYRQVRNLWLIADYFRA